MALCPPGWSNPYEPPYLPEGEDVPVAAGNKVVLQTDETGAGGAIQFNKDVDGLLFASLGKQDITVEGNAAANVVSLTNDLENFDPLAVQAIYFMGNGTLEANNGLAITGDYENGLTCAGNLTVNTLNNVAPGALTSVKQTGATAVSNSGTTIIPFDAQNFDFPSMWSALTPNILKVPIGYAGFWRLNAQVSFASDASGTRTITFYNTTTSLKLGENTCAGGEGVVSVACERVVELAEGDEINVRVAQSSPNTLDVSEGVWEAQFLRAAEPA